MAKKPPGRIRGVKFSAVCALALTCALAIAADAKPQAASGTTKTASTPSGSARKTSVASAKKTSAGAAHRKPAHSTSGKSAGTARKASSKSKSKRGSTKRLRGQQKIDSERAQSIQEALIREHYLTGEPTGTWNQASEDAMRKYQADHGWQSKQVPDSRALIKLGLGPSKEHLLNPESAMTTVPDAPRAESLNPVSHSADPGPTNTHQPPSPNTSEPQ